MKDVMKSKMQSASSGVWRSIPVWAKGVLIVGGAFIAYKLAKGIIGNTRLDKETRDSKQEEEGWYASAQQDAVSKKPTMSKTQMKATANKIWNAMDGYGTRDYDLIQSFKAIKNNADFSGVMSAYGVRTLQPGHGVGWLVASYKGTMIQSITNEADSTTIQKINKYLQSKGIKYTV